MRWRGNSAAACSCSSTHRRPLTSVHDLECVYLFSQQPLHTTAIRVTVAGDFFRADQRIDGISIPVSPELMAQLKGSARLLQFGTSSRAIVLVHGAKLSLRDMNRALQSRRHSFTPLLVTTASSTAPSRQPTFQPHQTIRVHMVA